MNGPFLSLMLFVAAAMHAQQQPPTASAPSNAAAELRQKLPPLVVPESVNVEKDITYASYGMREMKLDLYRPSHGEGPFPGVVFIHGGAWTIGGKADFSHQAVYLASEGYVCVSIEYRLSKEAPYPAALYDSKAAVRWMRANATKYKVDANKIAAIGGSSGGQLAAMLGTTSDVRTMEGPGGNAGISSRVQAVAVFNPLTDFVSMLAKTQNLNAATQAIVPYLGGAWQQVPETYMEASPIAHVSATSAPFLFLHGTVDKTMPYEQSLEMLRALQAVGVRAELYSAKDADHGFFNFEPFYQPSIKRVKQFLDSVFAAQPHMPAQ